MSQIGAGKVPRTRLQTNIPNVPNRENNYFPTEKLFSNGYGILSGHGPNTEQTKNLSHAKRGQRQTNGLLNTGFHPSFTGTTSSTVNRIGEFTGLPSGLSSRLSSGLPLHDQASQASPSTSVRAKKTAVAVNQRTTESSLLLERVADADADAGNGEDLFHFGKNFVIGLGSETKVLDVPFDKVGTLCGVAPTKYLFITCDKSRIFTTFDVVKMNV